MPECRTNSWDLPSLAVKCARTFFSENPDATEYSHRVQLAPTKEAELSNNGAPRYYVETAFSRSGDGLFNATQQMNYISSPPTAYKPKTQAGANIHIIVQALWLSAQGRTNLSLEELDAVAANISDNAIDLLGPLDTRLRKVSDNPREHGDFRLGRAVDLCHDMLERYQGQEQPWRLQHVEQWVKGDLRSSYRVRIPIHHLGKPYVGMKGCHRAVIALGSNVGNRMVNIEQSLQAMRHKGIKVRSTSFLYETEAMYYEDQAHFLNGVCEVCWYFEKLSYRLLTSMQVETTLEPLALLDVLQEIEIELGRVKLIDKGPRSIDLDILLYDFENFQHPRLQIPHKLMLERDFVLRPLAE